MLVGNKSDRVTDREVSTLKVMHLPGSYDAKFAEAFAKNRRARNMSSYRGFIIIQLTLIKPILLRNTMKRKRYTSETLQHLTDEDTFLSIIPRPRLTLEIAFRQESWCKTWTMVTHLKRICSAINKILLGINFELSQQSAPQLLGESGLSQELLMPRLYWRMVASQALVLLHKILPQTLSVSQRLEEGLFKKPRKRGRVIEFHQ